MNATHKMMKNVKVKVIEYFPLVDEQGADSCLLSLRRCRDFCTVTGAACDT